MMARTVQQIQDDINSIRMDISDGVLDANVAQPKLDALNAELSQLTPQQNSNLPDWIVAPTGPVGHATMQLKNPLTGEIVTVPSTGYSVKPEIMQQYKQNKGLTGSAETIDLGGGQVQSFDLNTGTFSTFLSLPSNTSQGTLTSLSQQVQQPLSLIHI